VLFDGNNILVIDAEDNIARGQPDTCCGSAGRFDHNTLVDTQATFVIVIQRGNAQAETITTLLLGCGRCLALGVAGFELIHGNLEGFALAFAPDFHLSLGTWLGCSNNTWQVAHLFDLIAIEFQDHITTTHACFGSRAIFFDMADQCTFVAVQTNCFGALIINISDLDTNATPGDFAVLFELINDIHGLINGDGQGNPHAPATARNDLGINPNHLALGI